MISFELEKESLRNIFNLFGFTLFYFTRNFEHEITAFSYKFDLPKLSLKHCGRERIAFFRFGDLI